MTWWLLPGTLCTEKVFTPLLTELAVSKHDCRTVPLNRAAIEDYATELEAVKQEDVILGFSLGSIIAAHYLDKVCANNVVLMSANPFRDLPEKREGRLAMLQQAKQWGAPAALAPALTFQLGAKGGDRPEINEYILDMAQESEADFEAQTQLAISRPGAESMIAAAKGRVLFLSGSEDVAAPPHRATLAASLGDHRFELIEGAGHYLPLEAPSECARHIMEFLKSDGDL